jgi:dUTP pyrophosphatase
MPTIKVKKRYDDIEIPKYATEGSSGFDLAAYSIDFSSSGTVEHDLGKKDFILMPGHRVLVGCGFSVELPEEGELQIRPRSGLAIKHGITVLNTPGTIDSDYRGEIKVILYNSGSAPFTFSRGTKIAQAVLQKVYKADFELVEDISETTRGEGGFGHTDKK